MPFRAVTYFIALTTVLSQTAGDLVITPRNTESKVGETAYFNCSTDLKTEEIFWQHDDQYIYTGLGILEPYNGRFDIDRNASFGSHNLVIHSVEPSDAGEYICIDDDGGGARRSAELVVLDNDPDCRSDMHPDGVIGQNMFSIPPDEVQLTCVVTYQGNIPPQMEWKKIGDNNPIKESVSSEITSNNRMIYTLKFKGDSSLDKSLYRCQTKRSTQNQYTCTSDIIKVLYFVGRNTTELSVVRGQSITCIASNSSFSCTSQWYHDNYTCPLSCDETITTHLLGLYLCTVKCHVRGKDYFFEALKAFVIEPTTSPLQSTPGTVATTVVIPILLLAAVVSIAVLIVRNRRLKRKYERNMDDRERMLDHYKEKSTPKTRESEVTKKSDAINNNHQFLVENIKSSHLIDLLHEKNCITDDERDHLISQSSRYHINDALLQRMRTIPFTEDNGQEVLECFRQAQENFVADVLENGGVVIKATISTSLVKVGLFTRSSSKNTERLKEKEAMVIERLNQTQGLPLPSIQNAEAGIQDDDIVVAPYCRQVRNGIIIWLWCKSEEGQTRLQKMYKSSDIMSRKLSRMFKEISDDCMSRASELLVPTSINIFVGDFEEKMAEEEIEVLHKIKEVKNLEEGYPHICGVAILNEKLFVVYRYSKLFSDRNCNSSKLLVYNLSNSSNDFDNFEILEVKELFEAHAMCSCKRNNCLYIIDYKNYDTPSEVLKISIDGIVLEKWSGNNYLGHSMSATAEGNVIITFKHQQKLLEYSPTGKLERSINLPNCPNPSHAIKRDDRYIVCHGRDYSDRYHRVCLVDTDGNVEKSFGHLKGSSENQLQEPCYLTSGGNGFVIVADQDNNRLLLLNSNLEFKTKIVPKNKQRFRHPQVVSLVDTWLVVQISGGVPYEETPEEASESRKGRNEDHTSAKKNDMLIEKDYSILVFDMRPLLEKYNG